LSTYGLLILNLFIDLLPRVRQILLCLAVFSLFYYNISLFCSFIGFKTILTFISSPFDRTFITTTAATDDNYNNSPDKSDTKKNSCHCSPSNWATCIGTRSTRTRCTLSIRQTVGRIIQVGIGAVSICVTTVGLATMLDLAICVEWQLFGKCFYTIINYVICVLFEYRMIFAFVVNIICCLIEVVGMI
jgi:hypothetical protein